MALFQNSVLNKYLKTQDKILVAKAYKKFTKYFHNPTIQQNIRESKEEQFQEGFLRELFVIIFGYVLNPNANYNLTTELKNEKGAKKVDGAILLNNKALAVIELKGTKTKDLESIRQQAFDYKANQTGCIYVITSNFEKVRFYINNAVEFEEFDLFTINQERFELLYLCLAKDNLLGNVPLKIKEASIQEEEKITKKFYADYSLFKRELFRDLVKLNMKNEVFRAELNNEDSERANKNIKHHLFKKSQKLIDRFLFVFFAEDRGLLPPNSTVKILKQWDKLKDLDAYAPLYDRYKLYFNYLDTGRKGTDKRAEIFAYNGGLFKPDAILDSLLISDDLLYKHTKTLANYDFESQVDVNILGHIFENSLNEIESVNAEIEGADFDKQKTKRKKDGVFYTPKYITKYIVDNTIGKLCTEKKEALKIVEEEFHPKRQKETKKKLLVVLENYRTWLLQLTILDPACGSGAFLNQALDYLIKEHGYIDELQTKLLGGGFVFPNIENTVLENNIFGVDLNEESVEIAKLSLWLRTAQPRRKLNTLNNNIKCGNSLIDSKAVAGDKAFKWEDEFPNIFKEKNKKAYHITTAIHDSRTSARMKKYKVRERREMGTNPYPNIIYFTKEDDLLITQTIAEIIQEDNLNMLAYNICADHLHLLLVCDIDEVPSIMQKIKGRTSFIHKRHYKGQYKGLKPLAEEEKEKKKPLWQQKYSAPKEITSQEQLQNTLNYIQKNRSKHELPEHSNQIKLLIQNMCVDFETAMQPECFGGFDVVIGNPPYVRNEVIPNEEKNYFEKNYKVFTGKSDLYVFFFEKVLSILKPDGKSSFIVSSKFTKTKYGKILIRFLNESTHIISFIDFQDSDIFKGIVAYPSIIFFNNTKISPKNALSNLLVVNNENYNKFENESSNSLKIEQSSLFQRLGSWSNGAANEGLFDLHKSLENKFSRLSDVIKKPQVGIKTGSNSSYIFSKKEIPEILINSLLLKPYVIGREVKRYTVIESQHVILLPYLNLDDKLKLVENRNEFVNEFEYLESKREVLSKRAIIDKGIINGNKSWYEFQQIKVDFPFTSEYIIYPDISSDVNFTLVKNMLMDMTCFGIPSSSKSLLGVLNSKLVKNYLDSICVKARGGYLRLKSQYILQIPIPNNFEKKELEGLVIEIIRIQSEKQLLLNIFSKYFQSQFSIEKLSRKLQNWHELEFSEFIKELNKAIKKVGGEKLSKIDEMEWMEVFETKKAEAQTLKTEIDKTDSEIDAMVYELYGLSEEEIATIEQR